MKRHFHVDWLAGKINNFEAFLRPLSGRPDLRFLEIGSFEGRASCYFLDTFLTHPTSTLIAIDPCTYYPIPGWDHLINPGVERIFRANMRAFGKKVVFHRSCSIDILPWLPLDRFDFIYVDGDHRRDPTYRDGVMALPTLKVGGVMIFDDYTWGYDPKAKENPLSPRDGIDRFLSENQMAVEVLAKNLQVVVRRIR